MAWLCTERCEATGQTYWILGNKIARYQEWTKADVAETDGMWDIGELGEVAGAWETDVVESRTQLIEKIASLD